VSAADLTFPLVPRRRLVGLSFGAMHSARRGMGSDVAGSRLYRTGDDMDTIDWGASAKLSAARDTDVFVVREHYADEAPRAVVVCDHRASMALHEPPLPWLAKAEAMRVAARLIAQSVVAVRGFVGYLDYADEGDELWEPPRSRIDLFRGDLRRPFRAPDDSLTTAFARLVEHRRALPPASFVFVLSDFLAPPAEEAWTRALQHRWDVVPVVIQDPVWEQSFPDVAGVVVPLADPATGRVRLARLSRRDVAARREANERRYAELVARLEALDLEPVLLSTTEPAEVLWAFLSWSEQRLFRRGRER
jgi:uncharacterized protein (DUF58 family)